MSYVTGKIFVYIRELKMLTVEIIYVGLLIVSYKNIFFFYNALVARTDREDLQTFFIIAILKKKIHNAGLYVFFILVV